jgi:5-methylcytosine-specific restriction endonuclease McrA
MGRCAEYGYIEGLEYDHIIPIADGGGNKERKCNNSA